MDRLVKRKDFLAAAAALRANAGTLLMQARDRADAGAPRIGFTVTKKQGNAVERNRIRRRLRAAARAMLPRTGQAGYDYVIVARRAALAARFDELLRDVERGLSRVHAPRSPKSLHSKPRPEAGSRRRPGPARHAPARADGDAADDR